MELCPETLSQKQHVQPEHSDSFVVLLRRNGAGKLQTIWQLTNDVEAAAFSCPLPSRVDFG